MQIELNVNGKTLALDVTPQTSLLQCLRESGFYSVKRGCDTGDCGACTVLLDGKPINSCALLAVQAAGKHILTTEGLGEAADQGWKTTPGLHPLQEAFAEEGAIQCGYCTPAMLMTAKELLDRKGYGGANPLPLDPAEVREALSGVLCRCSGYVKPVAAVMRAAGRMRGEAARVEAEPADGRAIGRRQVKLDAAKLAQGKPAFALDVPPEGMLVGKILLSPLAHARIKRIDASRARALPGVAAVLTYHDLPHVAYTTAGQSDPLPAPLDTFSLDDKVRFVGDRVALVAAETEAIAREALALIEVEYEPLPAVVDPCEAMQPGAAVIHDEAEYVNFDLSDAGRNLAAHVRVDIGNVEQGFAEADHIFEGEYLLPKQQQVSIEPHVVITYWDADDRLVIRTSTQVPFHVRRILAPVLCLPAKRIRVIKPRIGGGFGGKQEVLIEDAAAHLTIATGRPVRLEYSRQEEFIASRSRHPMRVRVKTGVKADGTMTANEMSVLSDTGAYGSHALTVAGNCGGKAMALYVGDGTYRLSPNIRFTADAVYTNTAPAGAFRGLWRAAGLFPGRVADAAHRRDSRAGPARISPEERLTGRRAAAVFDDLVRGTRAAAGAHRQLRAGGMPAPGRGRHRLEREARQSGLAHAAGPAASAPRHRYGRSHARQRHLQPGHGQRVAQDQRRRLLQFADRGDRHRHRIGHDPGTDGRGGAGMPG